MSVCSNVRSVKSHVRGGGSLRHTWTRIGKSTANTVTSALRRHNDITLEESHTLVANIGRTFLQYVFNVFFHQHYLVKITLVTLIWLVSSVLPLCRLNALR